MQQSGSVQHVFLVGGAVIMGTKFFENRFKFKSKVVETGFNPLPTRQNALSCYLNEIEQ